MKNIPILIMLFIAVPLTCMAESNIPIEQQVILEQVSGRFRYKELWKPTEKEAQTALVAIMTFLQDPQNNDWEYVISCWDLEKPSHREYATRELEKIHTHYLQYHVQFVGIIVEGKKRLYCNFFLLDESQFSQRLRESWKEQLVRVWDGGFHYWRIEYDLETGKCLNFESNSYA